MEKFLELIAQAAERIGIEAIRIWPQVVMITFVKSLCNVIFEIAILGASIWLMRRAVVSLLHSKQTAGEHDLDLPVFVVVLAGCLLFTSVVIFIGKFPDDLAAILYPEAATVMQLIRSGR